ncbi:hypothetical protein [Jannaschia sp. M317]|uniref:hypothetical protein n=1 Tax=Jannaschia sp. M317 TaxID=2867011 RepID=UPI0021A64ECF|nr:hypothetical protein [Jannaschia sp. M317]UWQ18866.1 hypothetical protein K3551_06170 [Jannaschia sp. M317]
MSHVLFIAFLGTAFVVLLPLLLPRPRGNGRLALLHPIPLPFVGGLRPLRHRDKPG